MLGKLIKNEFKAVNRLMLPLHLGLIVITIIGRFYIQFTVFNDPTWYLIAQQNVWYNIINALLIFFLCHCSDRSRAHHLDLPEHSEVPQKSVYG